MNFYDTSPPISQTDSFLVALFLAALLHVFILLGMGFRIPEPEKISRSIDITIVNTPSKKAPKNAKFLAQNNQLAAGRDNQKPKPAQQKLASRVVGNKKNMAQHAQASQPKAHEKKLVAANVPVKIETGNQFKTLNSKKPRPRLTAEALQQQIAQLGEQIRQTDNSSQLSKIKFLNQVSAHKYVAGQYIKDWENKVERTGNMNYPEVARKQNLSRSLIMDVGIKADGSIYSIRVTRSSGDQALDEAAKRIVRLSAPFAALPGELLQELDVLVITRVWKFSDESGMTTH